MASRVHHSFAVFAFVVGLPTAALAQQFDGNDDTPGRAGRISSILGSLVLQEAGSHDWTRPSLNFTLTSGDRLVTGTRSRAEVEIGRYVFRLADSTDAMIVALTDHLLQLSLSDGTMRLSVFSIAPGDSIEVDTPQGASIIRNAGRYRFETPIGRRTSFSAAEDFDLWSAERDRRIEGNDCSRYISEDIPGCADLVDEGRWDVHPVYGPIWYPRVAFGWAPYRYGRWVWVNPWGWTWVGEERWGYAPFHYGRWIMIGSGWAWAPGPIVRYPCYEPALVRFVGTPHYGPAISIGVNVWFPLAPREPYYPIYRSMPWRVRQRAEYGRRPDVITTGPRTGRENPYSPNPNNQPRHAEPRGQAQGQPREQPRESQPRGQPRETQPREQPRESQPREGQPTGRTAQPRTREPSSPPSEPRAERQSAPKSASEPKRTAQPITARRRP